MPRIRSIKPEFPQSQSMGNISRDARLTFIELWLIADDEGRLRGSPKMLASLLFPYDSDATEKIEDWLAELEREECVHRYKIGPHDYIQILNWLKHQKIDRPSASRIEPPKQPGGKAREDSRGLDKNHRRIKDLRIKEGIKDQGGEQRIVPREKLASTLPPLANILPLVDGTGYEISQAQIAEWTEAYPAVDVEQQIREFRAWLNANPTRRKTRHGICRAIVTWLSREQDKGAGNSFRGGDNGKGDHNLRVLQELLDENSLGADPTSDLPWGEDGQALAESLRETVGGRKR